MKKGLLAAVILLLLASSGYFAYRWNTAEKRFAEAVADTNSYMDSLATTVQHQAELRRTVIDEVDIEHLKAQGLTDPVRELRESLIARPDLIPFPGVHGGTMRFEPNIVLLDPPFAFATFEDGHIVGRMLLSYDVKAGKIEWKRLWAELI